MPLETVSLDRINLGPIRHPTLPKGFERRVKRLRKILGAANPIPLSQQLDQFKRDTNPESELAVWEHIAGVFEGFLSKYPTTDLKVRGEVLQVVLLCTMCMPPPPCEHLTAEQVAELKTAIVVIKPIQVGRSGPSPTPQGPSRAA